MKKLFISCPMKGRTDEAIKESREKMHKIAEIIFGEELEVIDSFIPGSAPDASNRAVRYLGKSIQKMAEADFYIGIHPDINFRGCEIENIVAITYGIKSTFVSLVQIADDIP